MAVGLTVCGATSCSRQLDQEHAVKRTEVQAKSALFEIDGISAPQEPAKLGDYFKALTAKIKPKALLAGAVPYSDVILYSSVSCQANWDQHCSGELDFSAPPGFQACKPVYSVASTNNSQGYSFTPSDWYTNDSEKPPRFRAYHFHIEANGSGSFLNQWGSNITLNNVGIRVIAASANNFDRYSTGCELPSH
jgi:hypothetical protein